MTATQVDSSASAILIDTREQNAEYITDYFDRVGGIKWQIVTFPEFTGCDYMIVTENGSVGIQRKTSNEIIRDMKKIREETLLSLIGFTDNPVLLVEEDHHVNQNGWIMRREGDFIRETGMVATAYYNFLNSVRAMGIDVVCTRSLDQSIWWLISTLEYLKVLRYPKPYTKFGQRARAIGMLCCIPNIGLHRAQQILRQFSIAELINLNDKDLRQVLSGSQISQFVNIMKYKDVDKDVGKS